MQNDSAERYSRSPSQPRAHSWWKMWVHGSVQHFFSVNGPRQIEQQSSSTDERRLSSGLPPSVDEVADDDDARSRLEAV